jgi:3',5'-cyclic AMP phosphodiesterase CpdA
MRLLVTADLHFNHARSRPLAIELIERMNAAGADGVLIVGDTAVADGDDLENCLTRFSIKGPKLFLCGNHELWTRGADSHELFTSELRAVVCDRRHGGVV